MYRATRISEDHDVVLLEEGSGQDVRFYCYHRRYRGWSLEAESEADSGRAEAVFLEISESEAERYFSHQADGMGFGSGPEEPFRTLQDAWTWVRSMRDEPYEQRLARGIDDDGHVIMDAMMRTAPVTRERFKEILQKRGDIDSWPEFEKRYEGKFKP
ncbi:MAG: hypothetical protein AAB554_03415 [Patescibacteria group bacterium]